MNFKLIAKRRGTHFHSIFDPAAGKAVSESPLGLAVEKAVPAVEKAVSESPLGLAVEKAVRAVEKDDSESPLGLAVEEVAFRKAAPRKAVSVIVQLACIVFVFVSQ